MESFGDLFPIGRHGIDFLLEDFQHGVVTGIKDGQHSKVEGQSFDIQELIVGQGCLASPIWEGDFAWAIPSPRPYFSVLFPGGEFSSLATGWQVWNWLARSVTGVSGAPYPNYQCSLMNGRGAD